MPGEVRKRPRFDRLRYEQLNVSNVQTRRHGQGVIRVHGIYLSFVRRCLSDAGKTIEAKQEFNMISGAPMGVTFVRNFAARSC